MDAAREKVIVTAEGLAAEARDDLAAWAAARGLEFRVDATAVTTGLLLVRTPTRLELRDGAEPGSRPLVVDLVASDPRRRGPLSKRQTIGRAIGPDAVTVVDATAGLGGDALLLARLGWVVTAVERHPVVAALLADGLRRAAEDPVLSDVIPARLRLLTGSAADLLPEIEPRPEVVYIDPMFPPRRKRSALPRREIRVVRRLTGDDLDGEALVEVARRVATRRVVVKRLPEAPALAGPPDFGYGGKLVRYDVYRPFTG